MSEKDVDELGKLIQTGISEETADPCDPRIIRGSPLGIGTVVHIHGPELIAPEGLAQESNPLLSEEDRPSGIQPDEYKEEGE
jgi:hypothetical protein